MLDFISKKFFAIVKSACERYAAEYGCQPVNVQLMFLKGGDGEVLYYKLKSYQSPEEVSFLNILNVKIDFRGYSMIVPQFIGTKLDEFAEQYQCPVEQLRVLCINAEQVSMHLYKGSEYLQAVDLKEI